MRKIFTIIILLCGIVGNSWAVCELTESTDRTPSDEDLYPKDPNGKDDDSRMALICEKGKCEDGEIVYVGGTHYIGNIFNSKGFTTVNKDDTIYKCKLGGNDKWVEVVRNRTSDDIPVSDDRQDFIRGEPIKEMYLYGKKASDGDYYTNVHYVKPDEKCGVECTLSTSADFGGERRLLLCDNKIFYCSMQSMLWEISNGVDQKCDYVSPEHVASGYTYVGVLKDGYPAYTNKSNAITGMVNENDLCWGCPAGEPFSDGTGYCRDNLDEAWCKWRKNKESKNTEWKTDHCECLDKGKEWNTEKHDCVERNGSGKTGSGSGKTGSGSGKTGGGKIGSGTSSDTKCGVKCNAQNWSKVIFCEGDIYYCAHGNNEYSYVWANDSFDFCVYSDPGTIVGVEKKVAQKANTAIYGKKSLSLNNGDFVKYADYCNACGSVAKYVVLDDAVSDLVSFDLTEYGYWRWGLIKGCTNNEDEAWCEWQKVKAKMNVKWENNTCKCLDSGKKWDNVSHTCIPDNGAGDVSGQGDKKITTANCKININATVKCQNSGTFSGNVELELSAEKCQKYQANPGKNLSEIARLLCANRGGVDDFVSNAEVQEAKNRIDNFMKYAESNPSVWKNAEGKFNTARLASDATAGVILGTVGGIVSAHVIKKKQVEKGFDSLHCTIGGQTVADWGDEFRVGLGK